MSTLVSVYQYPSENQNTVSDRIQIYKYQFINIHQRTKTFFAAVCLAVWYQFINIHQRTKTTISKGHIIHTYQFINIHQRTKTWVAGDLTFTGISLSISIREPKLKKRFRLVFDCISLSISIREPKHYMRSLSIEKCISLSISIREPKRIYPYLTSNESISLSISIREPKPQADYQYMQFKYQFINIHQRTKTQIAVVCAKICISLSISIREPKHPLTSCLSGLGISLSISIREPKPRHGYIHPHQVSVYQYPSENQNPIVNDRALYVVSVYQYPSENQNRKMLWILRF